VHVIAEDRERLAAVLNATHDGVLLLDPSGRVLLTNPRLEAYWGIRGYRLYGLPLADLLDDPELQLGERLGLARAELDDLVRTIRAGLALNFTRVEFTSRLPRASSPAACRASAISSGPAHRSSMGSIGRSAG